MVEIQDAIKTGKSVIFALLCFGSSSLGSIFVLFPLLPLLFVNRKLFRWLADHIIALWESLPVALLHILCGVDIRVFGDEIDPEENSIILMNHRTRLDWLFLWTACFPNALPRHKIILKKDLKMLPGSGWSMQCAGFMFIDRKWETDEELFRTTVEYVRHDERKVNMLLFPEGTDFNPKSRKRSDTFATTNNLPILKQSLYPRLLGFTSLFEMMQTNKVLDAIYDITVAYPKNIIQSEKDMLINGAPEAIYFLIKRHAICELPKTKPELEVWLSECWRQKEAQLEEFYKIKAFAPDVHARVINAIPFLYLSCAGWCGAVVFWMWLLWRFIYVDIYFLVASAVFTFITYRHNGLDRLELKLFREEVSRERSRGDSR